MKKLNKGWFSFTKKEPDLNETVLICYAKGKGMYETEYKYRYMQACYKGEGRFMAHDFDVWTVKDERIDLWMRITPPINE